MRNPIILTSLLCLWPGLSRAQGDQLPLPTDDIETITVTAERQAVPLNEVGSSIEILDAQDLAKGQYVFVLDALETLPGVSISQNGTFGGFAAVRIRGALSEQTLVLIDGVIVNDPSAPGGGFNFATLSPFDIERIEVLKGPQSTLYGSDAIGGVINIITKRPENGTTLSGHFDAGSYETFSGSGSLAIGRPKGSLRLSASAITSDGISKAEKRDGNTEKDGYEALTLSATGDYALTAFLSLSASARYVNSEAEFDGFGVDTGVMDADESADADLTSGSNGEQEQTVVRRLSRRDKTIASMLADGASHNDITGRFPKEVTSANARTIKSRIKKIVSGLLTNGATDAEIRTACGLRKHQSAEELLDALELQQRDKT